MELKRLNVDFEIKNIIDQVDDEFFQFIGYASTFGNVDRGDDIVEKGAFIESLKKMTPKLLWQHTMSEPLGVFTEIYEDEKGLYIKGKMPRSDSFVSGRVIPQIKAGSINSMSIGFNIRESENEKVGDVVIRKIKKVDLWEISLVTIPMNAEAMLTGFKSVVPFKDLPFPTDSNGDIDISYTWNSSDAIDRVRELTGSKESPSSTYKDAFLWYDRENEDNFGAYKLPIADVVDGKLKAIPRAIFAAAAAISGARGGVELPESERAGVINNINRYYEKMDRESPLEKGFHSHIDDFTSVKDVSSFLKAFGFSNNEANSLIGSMKRITRNEDSTRKKLEAFKELSKSLKELSQEIKEKNNV